MTPTNKRTVTGTTAPTGFARVVIILCTIVTSTALVNPMEPGPHSPNARYASI